MPLSGLHELNRKLDDLLKDPHPGLFTWRESLNDILVDMIQYAGFGTITKEQLVKIREV
jgi:hypothetical protein